MGKYDLVLINGKELAVLLIPAETKKLPTREYDSFNLVETEDGVLKAVKSDDIRLIQQPIEE